MKHLEILDQALDALKRGDKEQAQGFFVQVLQADPNEYLAWLGLAACVQGLEKRRYCLERALFLRPGHPFARRALEQLSAPKDTTPPLEAATSDPQVDVLQDGSSRSASVDPSVQSAPSLPRAQSSPNSARREAPTLSPATRRKPSAPALSRSQSALIILLALFALSAVAALGGVAWKNGFDVWSEIALQPSSAPSPTAGQESGVTILQLPPTWTPTPSPEASATFTPSPTKSLFAYQLSPTPIASITPYYGYWRLVIGRSVQGRPIEVYRFGSGARERMIIAGIHGGDEWNTIALADELIQYIQRHPSLIPSGTTLYILRSLNVDGEAVGRKTEGRLNANQVDLNRNFDVNWKSSWRSVGCASAPGTAGPAPGSEPETQAVKAFLLSRQVEALISYHSAGLGVFPSGAPAHPESIRLAKAISEVSSYKYPPVNTGCEYTGTLVDWATDNGVIAAVDLELNSINQTEFDVNLRVLNLLLHFEIAPPTATPGATVTSMVAARVEASPISNSTP